MIVQLFIRKLLSFMQTFIKRETYLFQQQFIPFYTQIKYNI